MVAQFLRSKMSNEGVVASCTEYEISACRGNKVPTATFALKRLFL